MRGDHRNQSNERGWGSGSAGIRSKDARRPTRTTAADVESALPTSWQHRVASVDYVAS